MTGNNNHPSNGTQNSALGTLQKQAVPAVHHPGSSTCRLEEQACCALVNHMQEAAVAVDDSGYIFYCNESFAKMVNLPVDQLKGTNVKPFFSVDFSEHIQSGIAPSIACCVREQVQLQPFNKEVLNVLVVMSTVQNNGHQAFCLSITDLNMMHFSQLELELHAQSLREKNLELERANKDLLSFTYLSSHDLQEPLRKIQTFADCILQDEANHLSLKSTDYFKRMCNTASRMQKLIEALHIYTQTRNNDGKFEVQDLNAIVREVVDDLSEMIEQKKAVLEIGQLGKLYVIRFHFRQLIYNLLTNALKFTAAGRRPVITIKSRQVNSANVDGIQLLPSREYRHISVSDNGIGFDTVYSNKIFEIFQRLHGQEEYKGTGIGLAICKRVVDNHHGFITACGELDNGARFDIYLPDGGCE